MSGSIYSWSTTATDNDDADGDIDWKEGMNAKKVNDSSRQGMARIAEYRDDQGGLVTIGGTANAITATLNSSFTALSSGRHFTLQPTSDNTDAVTLNVNGIGAKAIRKFDATGEVALASGDLQAGNFYRLIYDSSANSSAGAWICLNPTPKEYQASSSKLTDIAALTATDGNFIVGNGTTWVAESGATARASLGLGNSATKNVGTTSGTVAAGDDSRITGATQKTDLASTASSKGASLVGVQDSAGNLTATTVEAALAEIYARLIGVGQTWRDVSASRAVETSYQNTTGKPICVGVRMLSSATPEFAVSDDGASWVTVGTYPSASPQVQNVIVPPGHYYKLSGTGTITHWVELS